MGLIDYIIARQDADSGFYSLLKSLLKTFSSPSATRVLFL